MQNLTDEYKSKSIKKKLLSSQRITALDLARLMAMITMMQGHTLDALADPTELDINLFPWNIWHFMRRFTAPIFLMLSGTVHVFANKRQEDGSLSNATVKRRIKTALMLLFIGYLLYIPTKSFIDIFFTSWNLWLPFFQVNILQLIGVSLLLVLLAFCKIKNDKTLGIVAFILAMLIFIFSAPINNLNWFDVLPEPFAAYFSSEHGSFFPIFPYTGFMFCGVAVGMLLKHIAPEKRTKYIFIGGMPLGLVLIVLSQFLQGVYPNYFGIPVVEKNDPSVILNQIGTVFIVISLAACLYYCTKKLSFYYAFYGKKALFIYIAHLLIIYGAPIVPSISNSYGKSLPVCLSIVIAVLVIIGSLTAAYLYEYFKTKYQKAEKVYKYLLYGLAFYYVVIASIISLIVNNLI